MVDTREDGITWQVGVWDRMAEVYQQEIDIRFGPVIERLLVRANLQPGETVLDLGTGTRDQWRSLPRTRLARMAA